MKLSKQEQAYALALIEEYGATFDFYYRVDCNLEEHHRRFDEATRKVKLMDAINDGVRFELAEKFKQNLDENEEVHTYTEDEMAKAYAEMGSLEQTEDQLWGAVSVEN
ncbi:hypothetical protein EVJ32_04760 [Exiguobacterium sp. SH5S4]|uniref:hypothetical protein n=1 Tax=Exiguobacterium sp. SH5S4 TaxID=2510961 RepID=UPI001039C198|nr:hypothetical protein [Exiguobacterium sp. SH5S4]TCI26688.1 hypothetical protein EVJ32_04760 [Exiguobacterium sp. SH5S4]